MDAEFPYYEVHHWPIQHSYEIHKIVGKTVEGYKRRVTVEKFLSNGIETERELEQRARNRCMELNNQ